MSISQARPDQLRPRGDDDRGGRIVRVGPGRRAEAVERLVSAGRRPDRAAADRFLHYARTNAVSLDGLWARLAGDGRIEFSVLTVPSPGRTAMVFASHPQGPGDVAPVAGLIDHACGRLSDRPVDLAQALLDPGQKRQRQAFLAAGFQELAVLSYLERPLSGSTVPPRPRWPAGVQVETYREALEADLAAALERSYEHTLDCPGLYGLRRTADIIAGHKATGRFDPALWTLMRLHGQVAGVLLLNPYPGQRTVELVYLGLAPGARGRGLGRRLLRHGLNLLAGRAERTITLAVDERNSPALGLYAGEGFRPAAKRLALIRPLRKEPSPSRGG